MLERATEDLTVDPERLLLHVDTMPGIFLGNYTLSTAWEAGSRILRLAYLHRATGEARFAAKCGELCLLHLSREEDWNRDPSQDLVYDTFLIPMAIATDWLREDSHRYVEFRRCMFAGLSRMIGALDEWYRKCFWRNNHAVVSLVPYGVMARAFPEAAEAEAWRQRAARGVRAWVANGVGVGPDGDWFEGTFNYQNFLLFHLLFLFDLELAEGHDFYAEPAVRGLFESLLQAATPDGGVVNFNDNFHQDGYGQSLLTAGVVPLRGAAEYRNPGLAWMAERLRPHLDWDRFFCLFGDAASLLFVPFENLPKAQEPPAGTPMHFRKTGYVFLRDGWGKEASLFALATLPRPEVRFDQPSAALPAKRRTGHAHLDAGSFEFYFRGQPVSVEPGYLWFPHERITPAYHNTLSADGRPEPLDRWGTSADDYGQLLALEEDADHFVARLDLSNFLRVQGALRTITVELRRGRISWVDELQDDRSRLSRGFYHGMGTVRQEATAYRFRHGGCTSLLTVRCEPEASVTLGTRPTTMNYRGLNSSLLEKDVLCEPAATVQVAVRSARAVFRWELDVAQRIP